MRGSSRRQRSLEARPEGRRAASRARTPRRVAQPAHRPCPAPPASRGTARCWRRAAPRRRPGSSPATSPAFWSSLSSRGFEDADRQPSSVRSSSCSGNSTRGAPRRSSAATMRRDSSAKPAAGSSSDVLVRQLRPAVDHRPLDAVEARRRRPSSMRTVNTTAGRGPSGSRLAAPSLSADGYSGTFSSGR